MPTDDCVGRDDNERFCPAGPELPQQDPEQPVPSAEAKSGPFPLERRNLLAQREHFEGGIAASTEKDARCGKERI